MSAVMTVVAMMETRSLVTIGRTCRLDGGKNLPFIGKCLGHDVFPWRGTQVIRVASLQAGGVGGMDREAWGGWWADCAAELGADIFVLAETRIATARGLSQAVSGMEQRGYVAIGHCVDPCISPLIRRTCPLVVRRPDRRTERLHRPVATCDEGLAWACYSRHAAY